MKLNHETYPQYFSVQMYKCKMRKNLNFLSSFLAKILNIQKDQVQLCSQRDSGNNTSQLQCVYISDIYYVYLFHYSLEQVVLCPSTRYIVAIFIYVIISRETTYLTNQKILFKYLFLDRFLNQLDPILHQDNEDLVYHLMWM